MGFSWAYENSRAEPAVDVIRAALDAGAAHLDTSDIYGPFTNEEILGRALRDGWRERAVVATKGGLATDGGVAGMRRDGRPEHITAACEASLRRLGVDVIDLYYLHRVDERVPVEETWGAMVELVRAGKVRALGISEASVEQLDVVQGIHPVAVVQSELSIWTRDRLHDVLPWCREHGTSFVAFAPLGRGFLTGAHGPEKVFDDDDFRSRLPRFTDEARTANQVIVDGVSRIAQRHDLTPGQVALAWVLAQSEHVHVIPGTTRRQHLAQNQAAAQVRLRAQDLDELAALPEPVGSRY
ncbi:Predicted oxidoreductase [Quadrisphaera granulorum]|uniref:Aryl-alcohol dehydrogenase-like predicted oxidoreductase n=2 Tax=Quadrisphaera granulorum TaxID=317664 RepID=A0A316A740_9ACTN|nr:aryl-alcohol dehydrogenase-like predicted oxidoreductase [Quadrisphaera granulorum]SZE99172.1 Predicted oxidoreductase [Quadrisphaera granulorum]